MNNYAFTADQSKAIRAFEEWLDRKTFNSPFILSGFAGTGKTLLSIKFLNLVEQRKLCWTVVAPTHKAVGVIKKALLKDDLKPTFYPSTIHRLLRLKLKRKGDSEIFEQTGQTSKSLDQLKVVLIDESSMVSSNLLEIILKCANSYKTRLIFVGDPAQLPPVGEEKSPVFLLKNSFIAELKEVVRHKGPVLKMASLLRNENFICSSPPCFPTFSFKESSVGSLDHQSWLDKAKSSLKEASEKKEPDAARILCYTNKFLERLIPHARRAIHGSSADDMPVLPGEVLISLRPVMSNASIDRFSVEEEPGMLFGTNTEMIVKDVNFELCDFIDFEFSQNFLNDFPDIETLNATVQCGNSTFKIRLLPEIGSNSRRFLDELLSQIAKKAKNSSSKDSRKHWKKFFSLRDSFAYLSPASVLTVHRSQGSTFEEVFVASDIFSPKNSSLKRQLAYVAISRASKSVWLLGSNQNNNNSWNNSIDKIFDGFDKSLNH